VPLGRWHCWNAAVGFAQNVRCMVCGCLWSAHTGTRLVTGSALGPLALLECGGRLRTVCALLGGCVCLWSAHIGTRLVTRSALEPLALLECGDQLRTASALHGVYGSVCVPMVGAHRYSPGHSSALGPLALLECGGQLRTASALLRGCVCLWSAHTGTRLVTVVPLDRWHGWNAAVRFAQRVRCLVCFSLPAAALSSVSEAGDSVPWHRTYRYWSNPETGHHCLWSSLPSNKPAVAHKPVIACLSTGLIGGEASLRKGTAAPGPLFLQIVSMGGVR